MHASRRLPSQLPPQAEPSDAQSVRAPCGAPLTALQVPTLPATSQASHCWPQAALQHTASTQSPLWHCVAPEHVAPRTRFAIHTPAEQKKPLTQSLSSAQLPLHAVAPHTNGAQLCVSSGPQLPAPPQRASSVA